LCRPQRKMPKCLNILDNFDFRLDPLPLPLPMENHPPLE
jgi:hypothetical protein